MRLFWILLLCCKAAFAEVGELPTLIDSLHVTREADYAKAEAAMKKLAEKGTAASPAIPALVEVVEHKSLPVEITTTEDLGLQIRLEAVKTLIVVAARSKDGSRVTAAMLHIIRGGGCAAYVREHCHGETTCKDDNVIEATTEYDRNGNLITHMIPKVLSKCQYCAHCDSTEVAKAFLAAREWFVRQPKFQSRFSDAIQELKRTHRLNAKVADKILTDFREQAEELSPDSTTDVPVPSPLADGDVVIISRLGGNADADVHILARRFQLLHIDVQVRKLSGKAINLHFPKSIDREEWVKPMIRSGSFEIFRIAKKNGLSGNNDQGAGLTFDEFSQAARRIPLPQSRIFMFDCGEACENPDPQTKGNAYLLEEPPIISNRDIKSVGPTAGSKSKIEIELNDAAKERLARTTLRQIEESAVVLLNGHIQTAPHLASLLRTGKIQLSFSSGNDASREAATAVALLSTGRLTKPWYPAKK